MIKEIIKKAVIVYQCTISFGKMIFVIFPKCINQFFYIVFVNISLAGVILFLNDSVNQPI